MCALGYSACPTEQVQICAVRRLFDFDCWYPSPTHLLVAAISFRFTNLKRKICYDESSLIECTDFCI